MDCIYRDYPGNMDTQTEIETETLYSDPFFETNLSDLRMSAGIQPNKKIMNIQLKYKYVLFS